MKADVMSLLGRDEHAREVGGRAIKYDRDMTPLPNFEGVFARWAALLATTPEEHHAVDRLIGLLRGRLEDLALFDQAEVLAGAVIVGRHLRRDTRGEAEALHRSLDRMPPALAMHLRRLGVLT